MKRTRAFLVATFLTAAIPGVAQTDPENLAQLLEAGRNLLNQQLDARGIALEIPGDLNQTRTWMKTLQDRFAGEYVLDLSQLRPAAEAALPWLESSGETKPYAIWLRTRLDYFRAAEELQRLAPAPEPQKPNTKTVPTPRTKPTPEQQRRVWSKVMALEPWPEDAGKYVTQLKPVFTAERVPSELVWIAEVESSFQPGAKSPAGAAGLFQLMPGTAKQEGLRLWPIDQRYDPEKSAHASAKYLHALHSEFQDWSLALAAYNAGDGQVRTLMKRHGVRSYDRLAPHLPAETQLYVPKVEAVLRRREGKALAELKSIP